MKKFALIAFLVITLGGLALFATQPGVIGSGLSALFLNEEQRSLLKLADRFLEAIQYKDFDAAAAFHNLEDQKKVDIAKLIEQLFKVKPEVLNIRDIKVKRVKIDSTGKRARTFFVSNIELLNSLQRKQDKERKHKDVEGVLYWHKEDGQWKLKLESSLSDLKLPQ